MADRTQEFQRNKELEDLLQRLGEILSEAEAKAVSVYKKPEFPVVMVHGCARSGTTLLMQVLAGTGRFSYPTNFISRFYEAPYIGSLVQLMLTDKKYSFRNEFSELDIDGISFFSSLGKTTGLLAPNEFNYFWRRFYELGDLPDSRQGNISRDKCKKLLSELASLEDAFGKPLLLKGLVMNWHIRHLAETIDNSVFLHIKRDVLFNAQSLLEARKKFYGTIDEWYSLKPAEFPFLTKRDPYYQATGQVIYTNRAIDQGLNHVPDDRKLQINYQQLCTNPVEVVMAVFSLLNRNGCNCNTSGLMELRDGIGNRDVRRLDSAAWEKMESARDAILDDLKNGQEVKYD